MYTSLTIAHYYVKKSLDSQAPITHHKAEFLVYFAHGWHLAIEGTPLISEKISAMRHGPAIKSVNAFYHKAKTDIYSTLDISVLSQIKERDYEFLDGVWAHYENLGEVEMLDLCLEYDTPWSKTYESSSKDLYIDNYIIKQHYRMLHISNPDLCDLEDPISLVRV